MKIEKMAQLLLGLLDQCIDVDADAKLDAINAYDTKCDQIDERIVDLVRKRAGILPAEPGDSPMQRLLNPRLGTAYPAVRADRLRKIMLDSQTLISTLVGPLITAMLQLEFAEGELELEKKHSERVNYAKSEHLRDGIYNDVALVADRLKADYGVMYHHWKALDDKQYYTIAKVFWDIPAPSNSSSS